MPEADVYINELCCKLQLFAAEVLLELLASRRVSLGPLLNLPIMSFTFLVPSPLPCLCLPGAARREHQMQQMKGENRPRGT